MEHLSEDHEVGHKVWDFRKKMKIFSDWSKEDWDKLDKMLDAKYGDVPEGVDLSQDRWRAENVMKDLQQYVNEVEKNKIGRASCRERV